MNDSLLNRLKHGSGLPRICVPITARDIAELSVQAPLSEALPADLIEWRLDMYDGDIEVGLRTLSSLTKLPILCTIRTAAEGGEADIDPGEYVRQVRELIGLAGYFQLIDIELAAGDGNVQELTAAAHERGLGTVVSRHELKATPPKDEMISTLFRMRDLGADLPKLAVTPKTPTDVFDLMAASWESYAVIGPVITMSMGSMGRLSRMAGYLSGSCVTFGAGEKASAPGQIDAVRLRRIMELIGPEL